MSNRELAKNIIDQIPENKLFYIISYLQRETFPDDTPNTETVEAIEEVDKMIAEGNGEHFVGSAGEFFATIAE